MSTFQQKVLDYIKTIPAGEVVTYAQVARSIKNPKAFRAVGQALRRNPFPIEIPCHRVIRSDGQVGGYVLGVEKKIALLKKEGVFEQSSLCRKSSQSKKPH